MPNKASRRRRKHIRSVALVGKRTTRRRDVGKVLVHILNPSALDLRTQLTISPIPRLRNLRPNRHHWAPNPHILMMSQKLTSPRLQYNELISVRQYIRSDPPMQTFHQYNQQLMGYPSVVWQQQMEKATIITFNNTHLFQKPIPVWDSDYTTTFTTRFRPIPLIDDYNPTYIDPDYNRDPYWDTELYNQDSLQFQYVLDDIEHYNRTVHENPPITHNKKTRALIENWQMNDGTNHPVFPNP